MVSDVLIFQKKYGGVTVNVTPPYTDLFIILIMYSDYSALDAVLFSTITQTFAF